MPDEPHHEAQLHTTAPVIAPGLTFASVTDKISSIVLKRKTPVGWFIGFAISFVLFQLMLLTITKLLFEGIGLWGVNIPVAWGMDILNFVWWIGIGHAGTLISAILLLLRQRWRTSINRFAEAMTLFAVAQAGMYPIMHLGRPWMWDVFAVSTYATVSAIFWFVGLIPDFATLRDRARSKPFQIVYGMLAMGWRGSTRHWHRYEMAYLLLAGLATPLVLSVHTIVSFDFAVGVIPGWHATMFPPYFVAGAIYAGFAMVLLLTIPLRKVYGLESFITMRHMHNMAKVMLATGLIVGYGYVVEAFFGWYSGNRYERYMIWNRMHGPYAHYYWALILCNIITPQFLWIKKLRSNLLILWLISIVVSMGMWLERFVIVVTSLHRDFLPSSWGMYQPSMWDWTMFIGTIGFFLTLLFLFIRFLPMISIFEMRTILPEAEVEE